MPRTDNHAEACPSYPWGIHFCARCGETWVTLRVPSGWRCERCWCSDSDGGKQVVVAKPVVKVSRKRETVDEFRRRVAKWYVD